MALTIIVICVLIEMSNSHLRHYRHYRWADAYARRIQHFFTGRQLWDSPWGVLVVLLVPISAVAILQSALSHYFLGFLGVIFSIALLSYSLRYQSFEDDIHKLVLAIKQGDMATANYLASEIMGEQADSEQDLIRQVCCSILINVNERLFAVILWFVLLGPMGALLYRLSWFYAQRSTVSDGGFKYIVNYLHAILNWLPARLLPMAYALAGSFEDAIRGWLEVRARDIDDMNARNEAIIAHTGCSALNLQRFTQDLADPTEPGQIHISLDVKAIQAAHQLIIRAMLTWGIVLALVTLVGWAG